MNDGNNIVTPQFGAYVLETLTTGMYTNPLDTVREYVQNSFDAVRVAESKGILPKGAGRVEIMINESNRNIKIRDNGTGIPNNDLQARLINIGMSSKSINENAGFRGIGRLAGIAYCDSLIFRTQSMNESSISTLTFNCVKILEAMSPVLKGASKLDEVIINNTSTTSEKTNKTNHFFEVEMVNINDRGQIFFNKENICNYLSQIAPVDLDSQSFHLAGNIRKWLKDHDINVPCVSLTLSHDYLNNYQIFKPYKKLTYSTAQDKYKVHISNINFFPENAGSNSPYWGWYAETNCPGVIGDELVSGIRFRKANIGIGMHEILSEIFATVSQSYSRFNRYFIGEVHIQDSDVIPNARRDGFEDNPAWQAIKTSLVSFARDRSREVQQKSQVRNLDIQRLLGTAEKEIENASKRIKLGLASKQEKAQVLSRIDKQVEKLDSALESNRSDQEKSEINTTRNDLLNSRLTIENETYFTAQKLNSKLDKKQRKVIAEIMDILYETLEDSAFEKAREAIMKKYHIRNSEE